MKVLAIERRNKVKPAPVRFYAIQYRMGGSWHWAPGEWASRKAANLDRDAMIDLFRYAHRTVRVEVLP